MLLRRISFLFILAAQFSNDLSFAQNRAGAVGGEESIAVQDRHFTEFDPSRRRGGVICSGAGTVSSAREGEYSFSQIGILEILWQAPPLVSPFPNTRAQAPIRPVPNGSQSRLATVIGAVDQLNRGVFNLARSAGEACTSIPRQILGSSAAVVRGENSRPIEWDHEQRPLEVFPSAPLVVEDLDTLTESSGWWIRNPPGNYAVNIRHCGRRPLEAGASCFLPYIGPEPVFYSYDVNGSNFELPLRLSVASEEHHFQDPVQTCRRFLSLHRALSAAELQQLRGRSQVNLTSHYYVLTGASQTGRRVQVQLRFQNPGETPGANSLFRRTWYEEFIWQLRRRQDTARIARCLSDLENRVRGARFSPRGVHAECEAAIEDLTPWYHPNRRVDTLNIIRRWLNIPSDQREGVQTDQICAHPRLRRLMTSLNFDQYRTFLGPSAERLSENWHQYNPRAMLGVEGQNFLRSLRDVCGVSELRSRPNLEPAVAPSPALAQVVVPANEMPELVPDADSILVTPGRTCTYPWEAEGRRLLATPPQEISTQRSAGMHGSLREGTCRAVEQWRNAWAGACLTNATRNRTYLYSQVSRSVRNARTIACECERRDRHNGFRGPFYGTHYGGPVAPQGSQENCDLYTHITDAVAQGPIVQEVDNHAAQMSPIIRDSHGEIMRVGILTAQSYCADRGGRLPTIRELAQAIDPAAVEIAPRSNEGEYWPVTLEGGRVSFYHRRTQAFQWWRTNQAGAAQAMGVTAPELARMFLWSSSHAELGSRDMNDGIYRFGGQFGEITTDRIYYGRDGAFRCIGLTRPR